MTSGTTTPSGLEGWSQRERAPETESLAILGSTGSIGTQALDVVRSQPERWRVTILGACSSVDALAAQAREFQPSVVAIADKARAAELQAMVPSGVEVVAGGEAFGALSGDADVVLNAVVGFAGLPVTLGALRAGRRLALANKESLIAAGPLVRTARASSGGFIVPVDSEHCAVHQCLAAGGGPPAATATDVDKGDGESEGEGNDRGRDNDNVARLLLTASGGPFRGRSRADLADVTVADALNHPTWSMGPKITVDSSTLMNKGLEVIEAHELFDIDYDRIEVVIHPQSVVHSMVEFCDGSTIAQLSLPDMRLPIGYALAYPDRLHRPFGRIDWRQLGRLDFESPDLDAFECLGLAYEAGRQGETAPAWLNAANEVAVEAFLDGALAWLAIPDVLKATLDRHDGAKAESVDAVSDADRRARIEARRLIERISSPA